MMKNTGWYMDIRIWMNNNTIDINTNKTHPFKLDL